MISHTLMNRGEEPVRMLTIASPPRIETFMRELAKRLEESGERPEAVQQQVMKDLGTRVTGAPPGPQRDPRGQ